MGEVISLEQRRGSRAGTRSHGSAVSRRPACALWFDLASPSTYFAAERADRLFPGLAWRPVLTAPEHDAPLTEAGVDALHVAAAARAQELRMPFVWPEGHPVAGRAAMRVAAFAAERALASSFVLAASRLAFCGGFDLDDPEILAEAAAAAALPLDECLRAAGDGSRDALMEGAGRKLRAHGAHVLPVLTVGSQAFCGEQRLAEAAAAVRDPGQQRRAAPLDEFAG